MDFKKIFRRERRSDSGITTFTIGGQNLRPDPMRIGAVYRCVDVISDSVASLPLKLFKIVGRNRYEEFITNPLARMLNEEPDQRLTRFTFFKSLVSSCLLTGNGYAYIDRKGDTPNMVFVNSNFVTPILKWNGAMKFIDHYNVVGVGNGVEPKDMIHLLNYTADGLVGESTIAYASNCLYIANGGEQQAAEYYNGSGQPSGILTVQGAPLRKNQKEEIYNSWRGHMRSTQGGIAVLEGNMNYQPISINPSDAQLLESRQYSVIDICRFFGVSPVKCFDLSKSSYSTVEATQLAFLTDTLQPILTKIELEIKRKLFLDKDKASWDVQFDTSELLRADKTAQAAYYRTLVNIGAMTPNEVRQASGLQPIAGGDKAYIQTNMTTLEAIASGQTVKNNNTNNNNIDNNGQES
jgi:HK97 family phage portal protein